MKVFFGIFVAVCSFFLTLTAAFSLPAAATRGGLQFKTLPALSGAKEGTVSDTLKVPVNSAAMSAGDFDEFNNFSDPLSREGAKAFLKAAFLNDGEAGKAARTSVLRDAPADNGGKAAVKKQDQTELRTVPASALDAGKKAAPQPPKPLIKKRKAVKPIRVDPLKAGNII